MKPKAKRAVVTVGDFYKQHGGELHLRLVGKERGFDRVIREPTINRPGLALAGFMNYFARHRVQVFGKAELAFLGSIPDQERRERLEQVCMKTVPCLIIARNGVVPKAVRDVAARAGMALFRTPSVTMRFINAATIALELEFAPSLIEHGSTMEIHGMGVMIRGSSGVGKSECVLGLIERRYSLVSDDVTIVKAIEGRELVCSSPELTRGHIEVRGLGIINVASVFGVGCIRNEKRLDLVVTLCDWHEMEEIERVGINKETYKIHGIEVPHVTIPVRQGRDLARLVEVAAMDQKLKLMGQNSAEEFNKRLLSAMKKSK